MSVFELVLALAGLSVVVLAVLVVKPRIAKLTIAVLKLFTLTFELYGRDSIDGEKAPTADPTEIASKSAGEEGG